MTDSNAAPLTEQTELDIFPPDAIATYGDDPRRELIKRREKIIGHLDSAMRLLAESGCIYEQFHCQAHSDYCAALFSSINIVKQAAQVFASHQ